MFRKYPLIEGEVYHIFSRSIAGYQVFNSDKDYERMEELLVFYNAHNLICPRYSRFCELPPDRKKELKGQLLQDKANHLVRIVAYCLMPTHIHLILTQLQPMGVSRFLKNSLISYTSFFNIKRKRKGPLWEGRFKNIPVDSDEQLLHLTRYIHLNPTSADLVKKPEDWRYSSYRQYLGEKEKPALPVTYKNLIDLTPRRYRQFVNERKDYQRQLSQIKHLLIDNYSG